LPPPLPGGGRLFLSGSLTLTWTVASRGRCQTAPVTKGRQSTPSVAPRWFGFDKTSCPIRKKSQKISQLAPSKSQTVKVWKPTHTSHSVSVIFNVCRTFSINSTRWKHAEIITRFLWSLRSLLCKPGMSAASIASAIAFDGQKWTWHALPWLWLEWIE